jgi:uncharacterized damage-inducible protein DinB
MVEPWLRGTLAEEDAVLRGVLHALELAREDVARWCSEFTVEQLEARPFGLHSVAFQMRHIARSLDRLLTYAEDRRLNDAQLEALENEMEPSGSREKIVAEFEEGIDSAVRRMKAIPSGTYEKARWVGRGELPSSVGGLLVHCADHAQRHVGQLVTTAKVVVQLRGQTEDPRKRRRADERDSANPPELPEERSEGVS